MFEPSIANNLQRTSLSNAQVAVENMPFFLSSSWDPRIHWKETEPTLLSSNLHSRFALLATRGLRPFQALWSETRQPEILLFQVVWVKNMEEWKLGQRFSYIKQLFPPQERSRCQTNKISSENKMLHWLLQTGDMPVNSMRKTAGGVTKIGTKQMPWDLKVTLVMRLQLQSRNHITRVLLQSSIRMTIELKPVVRKSGGPKGKGRRKGGTNTEENILLMKPRRERRVKIKKGITGTSGGDTHLHHLPQPHLHLRVLSCTLLDFPRTFLCTAYLFSKLTLWLHMSIYVSMNITGMLCKEGCSLGLCWDIA